MSESNWTEFFNKSRNSFDYKLEKLYLEITENIIKLMEMENISRKELADKLGVSKPSISKLLNDGSNISIKRLLLIAETLNSEFSVKLEHKSENQKKIVSRVDYSVRQGPKIIGFPKRKDASCAVGEGGDYRYEKYSNAS